MPKRSALFTLACALALPAAAAVTVNFTNPDRFTDIGGYGVEAQQNMDALARHLQALGARYLSPGQDLRVEVLNVDLAGEKRFVGTQEIRIARGQADWPRIKLRYAVEAGGKTIASGEDDLSDPFYLQFPQKLRSNDALAHEKRLLENWFRDRFAR